MDQIVSIIVPVYNCKDYLERCIESILTQSYQHIQLILVDDGSTDGSGEICDGYALQDSRIQVIHQVNGGVSKARNAGLKMATGEWILFVDSDDYILGAYCEKMLTAVQNVQADIVIARPTTDRTPEIVTLTLEEIDQFKRACLSFDEDAFPYNVDAPWGKLFRRELIADNHILFPENLSRSEDAWFCATAYEHATSICILDWFGYVHVERDGSLCRRFSPNSPEMLERILKMNQEWVNKYHPNQKDYEQALWYRVLPGIDECERTYFLHPLNKDSFFQRIFKYTKFLDSEITSAAISSLSVKQILKDQYRTRLRIYKLHMGANFIVAKMIRQKMKGA